MLLSKPIAVGRLRLRNRIVLPPLVAWAAREDGIVSEYNLKHYATFQDVGLVVVEATAVSPEGRLSQRQIGAFDDGHLAGLTKLADVIHATGAVAAIQLHHAGGSTNLQNTFGLPLWAPSAVTRGKDLPQELTQGEIRRIIADFVAAAKRVVQAGFDAIELHGAHGYLVSQFLSPALNRREDEYGGSLANRARFALELFRAVQDAVGNECLVYMRLGVADGIADGLTIEEGQQVARWLGDAGMELLNISSGVGGAPAAIDANSQWSSIMQLAGAVKAVVDVPVIGVNGIKHPEQAEQALAEGVADLIAVGRAMLADPLWAKKALQEEHDQISLCRGCPRCGHYKHPFTCPARPEGLA